MLSMTRMILVTSTLIVSTFSTPTLQASTWTTSYNTLGKHTFSAGSATADAKKKALPRMTPLRDQCNALQGTLTYNFETDYCLLDTPNDPYRCWVAAHVTCEFADVDFLTDHVGLAGTYLDPADGAYITIDAGNKVAGNLMAPYRFGQFFEQPLQLRRTGESEYFGEGTFNDGICRGQAKVVAKKLMDGTLLIQATSPQHYNIFFGSCSWSDDRTTFFELKPIRLTQDL